MKKLLFLIPTLSGGGAERVLVNLVNNLDSKKYDITVMTVFDTGINKQYLNENIRYKYMFNRVFRGNIYFFRLFKPKFLYKYFIREQYDMVIAYLEGVPTRILAGCTNEKTKKITWIHSVVEDKKKFFRPFRSLEEAKKCYDEYEAIVGVSQNTINSLEKCIGMKDKILVKYNIVESNEILHKSKELIEDVTYRKDIINLITVGRLVEEKGFERLLRICNRLVNEGIQFHLYILGEGALEQRLRNYINEKSVNKYITLLGYKTNPYKYVKSADLFVCSSYSEGFSTAVTESLVVGTPVITTACSGMKEMLGENNEYGIIVENNEEELEKGLRKLLQDRELLKYYKNRAEERGRCFSKEGTLLEIEKLLDDYLGV